MTRRSGSYRDLLMQAAFQFNQVLQGQPARQLAAVEPRCLSAYLGFEAARYRLHLRRAGK